MKGLDNDNRLTFGKYKGKLIVDIIKLFPTWVKWAVEKGLLILPKFLKS